jgi:hypothetical protein
MKVSERYWFWLKSMMKNTDLTYELLKDLKKDEGKD